MLIKFQTKKSFIIVYRLGFFSLNTNIALSLFVARALSVFVCVKNKLFIEKIL